MKSQRTVVVIPARYGSTRFPGKVLAKLCNKPMIQHVYERAKASIADEVLIATDHEKVMDAVAAFGGHAVMTRSDHPSGTDRIFEAIQSIDANLVINVQGDEPLLPTQVINDLIGKMRSNPEFAMGTVAVPAAREVLTDPNKVKVVCAANGQALYFSRAMIPFLRTGGTDMECYLHWGIYAYTRETLQRFVALPQGKLEACEKLEQLRALENNIAIQVLITNLQSVGVDTESDLKEAERKMQEMLSKNQL